MTNQARVKADTQSSDQSVSLRYRLLGKSGLRVSEAALGTMTFGEDWGWGSSKDEAKKVYDAFREAGGNFIDTANLYTNGSSELFLGEFMQGHRESVVLATKYTNANPGTDPNAAGNHRKSMMQAVEGSLRRLQTDYIDLYWVHIWDQLVFLVDHLATMADLHRAGRYDRLSTDVLTLAGQGPLSVREIVRKNAATFTAAAKAA